MDKLANVTGALLQNKFCKNTRANRRLPRLFPQEKSLSQTVNDSHVCIYSQRFCTKNPLSSLLSIFSDIKLLLSPSLQTSLPSIFLLPTQLIQSDQRKLVILIIRTQQYRKMIISNQEVAVHIKNIRNLSAYTSGRFALRISVFSGTDKNRVDATPVNLIQKQTSKSQNRTEFDQQYFLTKAFPLKSGAHVEMQEIYLFKFDQPITDNLSEEATPILLVQLVQMDHNRNKVIGLYRGAVNGSSMHEYLEMDFYEAAPCQIVGSLHRCHYKFQFSNEDAGVDLKTFCEKYWKSNAQEILEYLENQSAKSYKSIAENYSSIVKRQVEISCTKRVEKKVYIKVVKKDVAERPTEFTEGDEETVADHKVEYRKKRKRIFSTTREHRMEKYESSELYLHQNAQKIYTIWRDLLASLFSRDGDNFIAERSARHLKKLREKVGESVSSFKGSWDVDMYCDEQNLRNQLADQLRNQDKLYFKQINGDLAQSFNVANEAFFSNLRPIFFEEKAHHVNNIDEEAPKEILVFLVHGLGACRLDMQKIKVELKRYYDGKVRIYTSSSNQGRTQGDIDSMGMRLAAEIDYQLSKYTSIPKICLLGHSMGGLIIRSALPRLQKYKKYFHSLITLSSPHLGYTYSTSKLVDAGLWFLNAMKKCTSIMQMTMQDHEKVQETFLYKLAQKPGLQWFKKVVFLASHQDLYVPYYSARIQKHEESTLDYRKQVKRGITHCDMVDNILSKVKGSIIRLDVNFCIPEQNIDNLIGRAAHISFINNLEMVRTFVIAGKEYFF